MSIYKEDGITPGGYYAERQANAASTQARLYAEIIDGDAGAEADLYVEVGGEMAYGPSTVVSGAPVALYGLAIAVQEGEAVSFVVASVTGGQVRDLFVKTYGAIS